MKKALILMLFAVAFFSYGENTSALTKQELQQLNEELLEASKQGQADKLKKLLDKGANPNAQSDLGNTALMFALFYEHYKIAKILLEEDKIDVNVQNDFDGTALMFASGKGQADIVTILLDKKANPNTKNIYGETALTLASSYGHDNVVKILKAKGATE